LFVSVIFPAYNEAESIGEVVEGARKVLSNVSHRRNLGKTVDIETGLKVSKGDAIFLIDADLQYSPEDIPKFLKMIEEGYDVVNGWRRHRGGFESFICRSPP